MQERAIRTRRTFLEAAAQVFDEYGYDSATIALVLERSGLTRGALYFHFTSKEELARGVLDEAVTRQGVSPQPFKLQEWVDIALLLAYRLPREPMLSAAVRLSVDPKARVLLGTRWPDWIDLSRELLVAAAERGELLPNIDPVGTARVTVGAWTGVQLVGEAVQDQVDLAAEVSRLLGLLLPGIAMPAVLTRLDFSADRPARLLEAADTAADS